MNGRKNRIEAFRRRASGGWFDTSLLASGQHRGCDSAPIAHWRMTERAAHPICFGCGCPFTVETRPGAFLVARASRAPGGSAAVAGLCLACWSKTPDTVECAALSLLRRQLGGGTGKFLE